MTASRGSHPDLISHFPLFGLSLRVVVAGDRAGAGAARGPDHSDVRLLLRACEKLFVHYALECSKGCIVGAVI